MPVIDLANPTRFSRIVERALPWLIAVTVVLFAVGLYRAMNAPDDYQQGATVKIMFLHVPAAWLGMFGWAVMSIAALGTLVWRHPLADVAGKAAAPIGAAFTFICLVTGSLWGARHGAPIGCGMRADVDAGAIAALSRRACALDR
jgi:heme exporter protein C